DLAFRSAPQVAQTCRLFGDLLLQFRQRMIRGLLERCSMAEFYQQTGAKTNWRWPEQGTSNFDF
ncbi:MAG: hypothetical protein ACE5EY_11210, partial [Anaerolineae bacterium]